MKERLFLLLPSHPNPPSSRFWNSRIDQEAGSDQGAKFGKGRSQTSYLKSFIFKRLPECIYQRPEESTTLVESISKGDRREAYLGHTPGNSFMTIETSAGKVVLTGETVMTYKQLKEDLPLGFALNLIAAYNSYEKLRSALGSSDALLFPASDEKVISRFRQIAPGVMKIAP
jgi:hypothetical protein